MPLDQSWHCVESDSVKFESQVRWPVGYNNKAQVYENFASVGVRYNIYEVTKYGQIHALVYYKCQHNYAHFIKTWHHYDRKGILPVVQFGQKSKHDKLIALQPYFFWVLAFFMKCKTEPHSKQ